MADLHRYLPFDEFNALRVVLHDDAVFTETVLERPKGRFVEYGPEDDWWLVKYYGCKYVTVPSKKAIVIGDELHVHRDTWEVVKSMLQEREEAKELRRGLLSDYRCSKYVPVESGFFVKQV